MPSAPGLETAASDLFAYGTLREGHPLLAGARHVGLAFLRGARLYDLGPYPGAVRSPNEDDLVVGDVFKVPEPAWPALDEYEGLVTQGGEYVRERVRVVLFTGAPVEAWAYMLASAPDHGQNVSSGDWLRR